MTTKKTHFGGLPPRYGFMLNPYPQHRISSRPLCEQKSRQRKLPLLIHVDPANMIALNYTCRYCPACDLLVAHKHELEGMLAALFRRNDPSVVGNDYFIAARWRGARGAKAWSGRWPSTRCGRT